MSEPGNLYCTGLYPAGADRAETARLSFAAALAVAELADYFIPRELVRLKWPNDVLIGGAKTAGILLENGSEHGLNWVMIGIGVNLQHHPKDTPYPATHIFEHINSDVFKSEEPEIPTPETALAIVANAFSKWKLIYEQRGFAPLREAWMERAYQIPGRVKVNLAKESFAGEAIELGQNGELRVRLENGTIREVHAGDVFYEVG